MNGPDLNRKPSCLHPDKVSELSRIGPRLLVIFDGHCGFCNRSVRWFLARDRHDRLRFAPYESPNVGALLARHEITESDYGLISPMLAPSTILAVRDPETPVEQVLVRSDAAIAMLSQLPQPWPAFAAVLNWIPRPLRDLGYRLIARFRYRIGGRLDTCPIPTAAERERFL
jgi:predicted DCC family thiol-disulfide oxidoreductase YuxK